MKRILTLLLVALLALSPLAVLSGCKGPDTSADTWYGAQNAPYSFLVPFTAETSFERTFNRQYARVAAKAASFADALVRAYLGESAGQQVTDYVAALLEWVEFAPLLADASPPKAVTRQVEAVESFAQRTLDGRLETIAVYQRLLDSAVWWMEEALSQRDGYCRTEAQAVYAYLADWLVAYSAQKGAEDAIVARVEEDLAWFQVVLAAPVDDAATRSPASDAALQAPDGLDATGGKPPAVFAGAASGSDAYAAAASAALEEGEALRYAKTLASPLDLVVAAEQAAQANAASYLADGAGYLQARLTDLSRAVGLSPSPTIAAQVQALSAIPSPGQKLAADKENAARVLAQVREYQQKIEKLLKPDQWKSTLERIKGLLAVTKNFDAILDELKGAIKDKLDARDDRAELEAYLNGELRQSIRNVIGEEWQTYLLQLAQADAQQIVDRFREWFDKSKNKDTFRFTEEEVRDLLTSLLQRRSAAVQATLPAPRPIVLPWRKPTPVPSGFPSGTPAVTPGITPGTTPAAIPTDPFHLQLSIQEATARVNGFMKVEEIMKTLYGIELPLGDTTASFGLGWHRSSNDLFRQSYIDERFEFFVSTDATGQIWGISCYLYDAGDARMTNVHEPAGHDLYDMNGRYFKVEFENDGKLRSASDFTLSGWYGDPDLLGYKCLAPIVLTLQAKPSGRGREYRYRNGLPREEYGFDGDSAYAARYADDGSIRARMEYKAVDPASSLGGKYAMGDSLKKRYDPAEYRMFLADGAYDEWDANGGTIWTAFFEGGLANGPVEHFWAPGQRDYAAVLVDGVLDGPFTKGHVAFDTYFTQAEGAYRNGQRNGRWFFYYYPGELGSMVTYVDGKPEGTLQAYYKGGKLRAEGTIHDGRIDPIWTRYRTNGDVYKEEVPSRAEVYTGDFDEFAVSVLVEFPGESPYVSPP